MDYENIWNSLAILGSCNLVYSLRIEIYQLNIELQLKMWDQRRQHRFSFWNHVWYWLMPTPGFFWGWHGPDFTLIRANISLVGGFNPSEKYESQLGWLKPNGKIKNVPNHQPVPVYRWFNIECPFVTRRRARSTEASLFSVESLGYLQGQLVRDPLGLEYILSYQLVHRCCFHTMWRPLNR